MVRAVEPEHGIAIDYAQAAASSVLARGLPDPLNTVAPGISRSVYTPIAGQRAEESGFRKALRAACDGDPLGHRRRGDDLPGTGPGGLESDATVGVILFGMDNGYRGSSAATGAYMLCRGRRCAVLSVSAEYTVLDLSDVPGAAVGDVVTIIGATAARRSRSRTSPAAAGAERGVLDGRPEERPVSIPFVRVPSDEIR